MRKILFVLIASVLTSFLVSCDGRGDQRQNKNEPGTVGYELVKDWPQLPTDYKLSQVTGVGVDTAQNILLFHRTGRHWIEPFPDSTISVNTILVLDRESGKILSAFGAGYFVMPHGLTVDRWNNVWVTDVGLHQVFKFTHDGQLLMKWGEARKSGNDSAHFFLPTDVAIAGDGSFYVSDGYGNSRVVHFSAEGHFIGQWGSKGDKPGEFNIPHGIDLDSLGNVFVADRENNRIQSFSPDGKFQKEWKNDSANQLYSLTISRTTGEIFAIDYLSYLDTVIKGSDVMLLDPSLKFLSRFGRSGNYSGPKSRYHDIAVDRDGNLYVGDILGNTIQKFQRTHR
jgi:peptidylamidoglycolate lyase